MGGPRHLDPEALGDHIDRLYRAAWAMCGSREDAEDLVQETFAKVLTRPRLLYSDDDLGYLLRVLRNTWVSKLRTASRRPVDGMAPEDLEMLVDRASPDPQRHLETAELYAAVAALPPDFRDVVVAVDVAGLSYAEAGRALRVREATVTTRLFRARKRLAEALSAD
jgi:RNA polymerase sigma-70 factor (ECF subfamily)